MTINFHLSDRQQYRYTITAFAMPGMSGTTANGLKRHKKLFTSAQPGTTRRTTGWSCSPCSSLDRRIYFFFSWQNSGSLSTRKMLMNAPQRSHVYSSDYTVQDAPRSLTVCVISVRMLSFCYNARMIDVIYRGPIQFCNCISPLFSKWHNETFRGVERSITCCLRNLQAGDDTSTRPSGRSYPENGLSMTPSLAHSLLYWSVMCNVC